MFVISDTLDLLDKPSNFFPGGEDVTFLTVSTRCLTPRLSGSRDLYGFTSRFRSVNSIPVPGQTSLDPETLYPTPVDLRTESPTTEPSRETWEVQTARPGSKVSFLMVKVSDRSPLDHPPTPVLLRRERSFRCPTGESSTGVKEMTEGSVICLRHISSVPSRPGLSLFSLIYSFLDILNRSSLVTF